VPAKTARRDAAQDEAALPSFAHRGVDAMETPQHQKIRDRTAAHPDKVARGDPFDGIGRRLCEELEFCDVAASGVEGLVQLGVPLGLIAARGLQETYPRSIFFGGGQAAEDHLSEASSSLHWAGHEAARGGENSGSSHHTFLSNTLGLRRPARCLVFEGHPLKESHGHERSRSRRTD
jgi:hypothetical protein